MSQRTFFDDDEPTNVPEWEGDDESAFWRARVVFPSGADGVFDYKIPEELIGRVTIGMRLLVPLGRGNRSVTAYCVETVFGTNLTPGPGGRRFVLKEVTDVLDEAPLLSAKMLDLARWLSDRYLCPLGTVLEAILPAGVRFQAGTRMTTVCAVIDDLEKRLAALSQEDRRQGGKGTVLTPKQRKALLILQKSPEPMTLGELAQAAKTSLVPVNALKTLGLLRQFQVRRKSAIFEELYQGISRTKPLKLNPDQAKGVDRILDAIRSGENKTFLLHGVTGSGKTEVYLQTIAEIVSYGKEAIVLVPEISLTPQTVRRFRQRFGAVAVLHSHLTDSERHVEWSRIASGAVRVVIGARSAVFAPLPHLGLIVIDEEQETSFKQETAPRYHAREVALFRARQEKIPLVLGSATPSLESWFHADRGDYELISMPKRVNDYPLPRVELVDLRTSMETGFSHGAIHRKLFLAIQAALEEDGQVILFLNRRGYSTRIQCPACGEVLKCPNCDVPLTHHQTEDAAICHYCDYEIPIPKRCPTPGCGYPNIRFSGFGTQRLEKELAVRFAGVPILRMDMDTMQGRGAHETALTAFRRGDYKILLGTQMIAKGLDFPNVVLVGVISADTSLYHPDFRASERTFHLITQVAGRTGRGEKGGRVIVQTFVPNHPAIVAATRHDYRAFVEGELPNRRRVGYPPFTEMIRFVVRGPDPNETAEFARNLADRLRGALKTLSEEKREAIPFRLLGPAPAAFPKLRGNWRFHLHLHAERGELLREAVRRVSAEKIKKPNDIQWIIDVDPIDML